MWTVVYGANVHDCGHAMWNSNGSLAERLGLTALPDNKLKLTSGTLAGEEEIEDAYAVDRRKASGHLPVTMSVGGSDVGTYSNAIAESQRPVIQLDGKANVYSPFAA